VIEAPATGRVLDVAVLGVVNAGKSSLINALAGRPSRAVGPVGGTTGAVEAEEWGAVEAEVGPFAVRLIDTPGLEEVGDTGDRGRASIAAAREADLALFVVDEDLTATARAAIADLRGRGKPLIVALNKADLREPDEQVGVLTALRSGLAGLIDPDDVIAVAAAPLSRRREVDADGNARVVTTRGEPEVGPLRDRLRLALGESATDLKALAAAAVEVEGLRAERAVELSRRRAKAERAADETSVAMAMALAINPVPLLDLLAGPGGIAVLVKRVADVYDERLSAEAIRRLAGELLRGGSLTMWGSLAAAGAGGAMKLLPGLGHVAGAVAQGTAAGYFGHVLGRALVGYFENGRDWGEGGLIAALDRIAATADRRAITRGLADRLKERLKGGRS